MPAQYITSRKLHTHHHHKSPTHVSRNSFARPQESANAPIDRRRRQRSNHLPVSATYYRETDASFNLLLARHGPLMHECMHAYSGRAIPKGHLQFMPARTAVRLVSPLHFFARLPSHALPVDGATWDTARTKSTRIMHMRARPRTMFESPALYQRGKCNLVSCRNTLQYQI